MLLVLAFFHRRRSIYSLHSALYITSILIFRFFYNDFSHSFWLDSPLGDMWICVMTATELYPPNFLTLSARCFDFRGNIQFHLEAACCWSRFGSDFSSHIYSSRERLQTSSSSRQSNCVFSTHSSEPIISISQINSNVSDLQL